MRFPLLCTLLLAACAGGDKAAETTDGPAALTAAALAGTWNGTSTAAGSDSVSTWTITMTSDSTGTFTTAGAPDLPYTVVFGGDSAIATSASYVDPALGTDMIMWQSVGRLDSAGTFAGSFTTMLAAKHDSVVARGTWRATKAP